MITRLHPIEYLLSGSRWDQRISTSNKLPGDANGIVLEPILRTTALVQRLSVLNIQYLLLRP